MARYTCDICERTFSRKKNLTQHCKTVHGRERHRCIECWQEFTRKFNLTRHYRIVHTNLLTPTDAPSASDRQTEQPTLTSDRLTEQPTLANDRQTDNLPIQLKRQRTYDDTTNKRLKTSHNDSNVNLNTDAILVDDLRGDVVDLHLEDVNDLDLPLDEIDTLYNLNSELQNIYIDNWHSIQTHTTTGKHLSRFNFFHNPLHTTPIDWDTKLVDTIFNTQTKRFKINYSHHTILKHKETGEYRFFHSSNNNACVLELPKLINNRVDFKDFLEHLNTSDILNYAQHNRPNTKYAVEIIPATTFYLYHLNEFPIG
ncbi:uncharacterized protein LOC131954161 [Physella acuta]|uniref:uncharacterized protein LOC131954159 n=1 Tax=Physella acuta TaxID=109671 RepID=UPI0027DDB4BC|nr:uncharacterized protein LOC131954159 [Physella acuta]XP_059173678.1 uncharacterized protein LOC131954159 [Physella acuta]XP_059173679.1 uncharacterized protein LOC131954159 [Physella acuta]XP_059173680.1 uncharacterized protein LOC131954161 [Physella acuta]XP_059173681.1 uncharacterized protein LOC131954161 [Physella acuta]